MRDYWTTTPLQASILTYFSLDFIARKYSANFGWCRGSKWKHSVLEREAMWFRTNLIKPVNIIPSGFPKANLLLTLRWYGIFLSRDGKIRFSILMSRTFKEKGIISAAEDAVTLTRFRCICWESRIREWFAKVPLHLLALISVITSLV